jgi:CHASE2 domain-containing sensor protein
LTSSEPGRIVREAATTSATPSREVDLVEWLYLAGILIQGAWRLFRLMIMQSCKVMLLCLKVMWLMLWIGLVAPSLLLYRATTAWYRAGYKAYQQRH